MYITHHRLLAEFFWQNMSIISSLVSPQNFILFILCVIPGAARVFKQRW